MTTALDPGPITTAQRALYDAIEENGTQGTALMSVVETATGLQRAVICTVGFDGEEYVMRPIALLLEHEDDMDRFTPPGGMT